MPDKDIEKPPSITAQKIIFWPALNFRAGGWTPFLNNPPPALSHSISTLDGILCFTQRKKDKVNPAMKANER